MFWSDLLLTPNPNLLFMSPVIGRSPPPRWLICALAYPVRALSVHSPLNGQRFPQGQFPTLRLAAWISLIAVIETGFLGLPPLNHVWVNSFVLWSLQLAPVLHVLSGGGELFDVSLCLRPFPYRSCRRFCHRFSPLFTFTLRSASPKVIGKRGNMASFSGQGDWKKYHLHRECQWLSKKWMVSSINHRPRSRGENCHHRCYIMQPCTLMREICSLDIVDCSTAYRAGTCGSLTYESV